MEQNEWCLVTGIIILFVIMCIYYSKSSRNFGRGLLRFLFGAVSGIVVLYPVHFAMTSMGYSLSVNLFTLSVSGVLGIPGVILLAAAALL